MSNVGFSFTVEMGGIDIKEKDLREKNLLKVNLVKVAVNCTAGRAWEAVLGESQDPVRDHTQLLFEVGRNQALY